MVNFGAPSVHNLNVCLTKKIDFFPRQFEQTGEVIKWMVTELVLLEVSCCHWLMSYCRKRSNCQ
jgi:hypothetical protein